MGFKQDFKKATQELKKKKKQESTGFKSDFKNALGEIRNNAGQSRNKAISNATPYTANKNQSLTTNPLIKSMMNEADKTSASNRVDVRELATNLLVRDIEDRAKEIAQDNYQKSRALSAMRRTPSASAGGNFMNDFLSSDAFYYNLSDNDDFQEYAEKGKARTRTNIIPSKNSNFDKYTMGNRVEETRRGYDVSMHYDGAGGKVGQMTDDEVDIYNYLLAKNGYDSAEAYIKSLEGDLNNRLGKGVADAIENSSPMAKPVLDEGLALATAMTADIGASWGSLPAYFMGTKDVIPTNAFEIASEERYDNMGEFGRTITGATRSGAAMLPAIAAGTVTSIFAPHAGKYVGGGVTALQSAGGSYRQDVLSGREPKSARGKATVVGLAEGFGFILGNTLGKGLGIGPEKTKALTSLIANNGLRAAADLGIDILTEITEEEAQLIVEKAADSIFYGDEFNLPNKEEIKDTAIQTALVTLGFNGRDVAKNYNADNSQLGQVFREYNDNDTDIVEVAIEEGLSTPKGSESYTIAKALDKKVKNGGEVSDHQLGTLIEANRRNVDYEAEADVETIKNETFAQDTKNMSLEDRIRQAKAKEDVSLETPTSINPNAKVGTVDQKTISSFGYGKTGTEAITDIVSKTKMAPEQARRRFQTAYEAGRLNLDRSKVDLLDNIQETAYIAGRQDAILEMDTLEGNDVSNWGKKSGLVKNEFSAKYDKKTYSTVNTIAKAMGTKVIVENIPQEKNANGYYRSSDGTIHIDANLDDPVMTVVKHEITHRMKDLAPKEYMAYRDFAVEVMSDWGLGRKTTIEALQLDYRNQDNVDIDVTTAMDEIAADMTRAILSDEKALRRFIDHAKTSKANMNMANKFFQAVREFINKIKTTFSGNRQKMDEATRDEFGLTLEQLERAESLWKEAYRASETSAKKINEAKTTGTYTGIKKSLKGLENKAGQEYNGDIRYSLYDEYTTRGMQWAYHSDTQVGDRKVLYNSQTDEFVLVVATKEDVGFTEVNSGSYEQMNGEKEYYGKEKQRKQTDGSKETVDKVLRDFGVGRNNNSRNNVNAENRRTGKQYADVSKEKPRSNGTTDFESTDGKLNKNFSLEASFDTDGMTDKDSDGNTFEENEIDEVINQSMTMEQAKDMIQRAFVIGGIKEWFDGEYQNGDEWLKGEGADAVALVVENEWTLQQKFLDKIQDLNEEFFVADIIEAYEKGTLTGKVKQNVVKRLDVSKTTNATDTRVFAPKEIKNAQEVYKVALERVTNTNREKVNQARADIIMFAHNRGAAEALGLTQSELNKKLATWARYTARAKEVSMRINKDVALFNKWTGIENSNLLNRATVSQAELDNLVNEVKGDSNGWQRSYIMRTMLALDTHIDYSELNFEFVGTPKTSMGKSVNGFYDNSHRKIEVKYNAPHTVAHEMGHFIDYQWARDLGCGGALTDGFGRDKQTDADVKQFLTNFDEFIEQIENVADLRSEYTMDRKEVFARFVAKFVQWVDLVANGRRSYAQEYLSYNDKFTATQYIEFIRLLQEKSMIDSKRFNRREANVNFSLRETDNIGTFDKSNPDIYHSRRREGQIMKDFRQMRAGEISPEEFEMRYDALLEQHGAISKGENPARDIEVPRKTADGKKVSQTARTILEAGVTPDEVLPDIKAMVTSGVFSYDVYTDKKAIEDAEERINSKTWNKTLNKWFDDVKKGKVSKANTALGWALYNNAVNTAKETTSITEKESATNTALDILNAIVGHQRNAAQALQATRILKKLSPETQLYSAQKTVESLQEELKEKYGKDAPELKIDRKLAQEFLDAETQEDRDNAMKEIYRDIGRQMPSNWVDKFNALRYFAMLGNVRTHVRNIVGNAGFAPIVNTKNTVATAIESTLRVASRGKFQGNKAVLISTSKQDRALIKAAYNDYKNVADIISGNGKYNESVNANKYIEEGKKIFQSKALQPLEKVIKGNSALLEIEDVWFSKPHYAYALAQYCKSHNITAEQIEKGIAILPARAYAIKEAQKATYKDTNALSQTVSGLGRARKDDNILKKGIALGTTGVLPYRQVPANVLARGIEYSPIGIVKSLSYDLVQAKKGEITAADVVDNLSAGLTGTGLVALGLYLTAQGLIRGHGGDDEREKEYNEMMGHQTYSLEVDDTSITLDWLAPEALPFFVGVNLWEMTKGKKENMDMATILTAIGNVGEPMLEMSCLQGLNDLLGSVKLSESDGVEPVMGIAASAVTSYLSQYVPTLLGQFERTSQEDRMTTYAEKNKFLTKGMQRTLGKVSAKIPGWDFNQIPYIDAWGRKEVVESKFKRGLNNFLNPAYMSNIETSDMEKELLRLYESTRKGIVFPKRADSSFNIDGKEKVLNGEEYVMYATKKGQISYDMITELVNSEEYQNFTDAERVEAIGKTYDYADQKAKTAVSNYNPEKWVNIVDNVGVVNYSQYRRNLDEIDDNDSYSLSEKADALSSMDLSNNELAYLWDTEEGWEAYKKGIRMSKYIDFKDAASGFKADKDKNGKSISGSKKEKVVKYLNKSKLRDKEWDYFYYELMGYKE